LRTGTAIDPALRDGLPDLFGYTAGDLDVKIPPARIHGGADHVVLALRSRKALARMAYDFEQGRVLMEKAGLVTVALVTAEMAQLTRSTR
jgi:predicted PhzF superfamily epimerase YddE/YHI9